MADEWSKKDIARQVAFFSLLGLDIEQTKDARRKADGDFQDLNPLLGNNPSNAKINTVGALTALGHTLIADALPAETWRPAFQWGTIAAEGSVALRNRGLGFRPNKSVEKALAIGLTAALLAHYGLQNDENQILSLVMDAEPKLQFTMKF